MNYTLQTAQAKAIISSKGGELLSLQSSDGLEYVWQGDPAYWASHAPHLFPYVGRLTEGRYIMDNQKHSLGIHGFFRFQELKAGITVRKFLLYYLLLLLRNYLISMIEISG